MRILIDGYNLLHQTPHLTTDRGRRWLVRARQRLLNHLIRDLSVDWQRETHVVFDSSDRDSETDLVFGDGLSVQFSSGHAEADDLIEALISQHSFRRSLLVVSSDHRLQEYARRAKATAIDSDMWFDSLELGRYRQSTPLGGKSKLQPVTDSLVEPKQFENVVDRDEIDQWLAEFGFDDRSKSAEQTAPSKKKTIRQTKPMDSPSAPKPSREVEPKPKSGDLSGRNPRRSKSNPDRVKRELSDSEVNFEDLD
jgi:predicted RNA-binding protein with PIN domain